MHIVGDYELNLYEMVLHQIKHEDLGQTMNFHVTLPKKSDKDTVAFIHLRSRSDTNKLKDILDRMFFYGSFLQAGLNDHVMNSMDQWS